MDIHGARRVIETESHETANQYLRFGWSLINQYVVEATGDKPSTVRYVLASLRSLEDTRQVVVLVDPDEVNAYLALGWKLTDKHVTSLDSAERRHETLHFVLTWQSDDRPLRPGAESLWTSESEFEVTPEEDDAL